jgi:hypothetical protein
VGRAHRVSCMCISATAGGWRRVVLLLAFGYCWGAEVALGAWVLLRCSNSAASPPSEAEAIGWRRDHRPAAHPRPLLGARPINNTRHTCALAFCGPFRHQWLRAPQRQPLVSLSSFSTPPEVCAFPVLLR